MPQAVCFAWGDSDSRGEVSQEGGSGPYDSFTCGATDRRYQIEGIGFRRDLLVDVTVRVLACYLKA